MKMPLPPFSRRNFLHVAGIGALSSTMPNAFSATSTRSGAFPSDFMWGAATAGHQVEGNNTNSDTWVLEHVKPSLFGEPSNDACDSYHRYPDDIALVKKLGLNTYRFSLEWARIEPVQGSYSRAELAHYRQMLQTCRAHGLKTFVTFNHFSLPRWFAALGGWECASAPQLFSAYCARVAQELGDLMDVSITLNEPNIVRLMRWLPLPPIFPQVKAAMQNAAAASISSPQFGSIFTGDPDKMLVPMLESHRCGYEAIKGARPGLPVGFSLAVADEQSVGIGSQRDTMQADVYDAWLNEAAHSDFVGVQNYTRYRIDAKGIIKPQGVEVTQTGDEYYPEALEATIRRVHSITGKPIYVSENGIATEHDQQRIDYIWRAVQGVENCLKDGIPVRGYIHWSLLDNFEWIFGFRPKFGLAAVDPVTFIRSPKPSAHYLGALAKSNGALLSKVPSNL